MDMEELLEDLENDLVRFARNYFVFKAWYALHVTILCLKLGTLCNSVRFARNYFVFEAWYALHVTILCLKDGMLCTQLFCV
nr:unnamed protein product [Callosobruchus analis]CAI5860659.1 unnamed protein product [Callosobruchus analis]CAI5862364.1 unnamed protein product [Callosobruchus analis]